MTAVYRRRVARTEWDPKKNKARNFDVTVYCWRDRHGVEQHSDSRGYAKQEAAKAVTG